MAEPGALPTREARTWRQRFPYLYRQALIVLLVALFVFSILLPRLLVFVEAGEAGVLFRRLAGGVDHAHPPIGEGLSLKLPWNDVTIYNLRLQNSTQEHDLVTRDGLHIDTEVSFRFRPCYGTLAYLHQDIGPDYLGALLVPQVGALLRQVVGLCSAEEVYSTERADIQNAVLQELRLAFSGEATGGELLERHIPRCTTAESGDMTEVEAHLGTAGGAEPAPGGEVPNFRTLARQRAHEELRGKLPQRFADIVVQADAIADDTVGAELLAPEADRDEVCGISLKRLLQDFRASERNVPAFVRGAGVVAGDDLLLVQDVLIRSVTLPPGVREAIESKVQQQQAMLGYRYRVSQELLESLRKEAEGLGVSAFQAATGPNGVNADYLRWQGIAATAGLAASPNAKLVVIGGRDGLPLILNTEAGLGGQSSPRNPAAAPAAPDAQAGPKDAAGGAVPPLLPEPAPSP